MQAAARVERHRLHLGDLDALDVAASLVVHLGREDLIDLLPSAKGGDQLRFKNIPSSGKLHVECRGPFAVERPSGLRHHQGHLLDAVFKV